MSLNLQLIFTDVIHNDSTKQIYGIILGVMMVNPCRSQTCSGTSWISSWLDFKAFSSSSSDLDFWRPLWSKECRAKPENQYKLTLLSSNRACLGVSVMASVVMVLLLGTSTCRSYWTSIFLSFISSQKMTTLLKLFFGFLSILKHSGAFITIVN